MLKKVGSWLWWKKDDGASTTTASTGGSSPSLDLDSRSNSFSGQGNDSIILSPTSSKRKPGRAGHNNGTNNNATAGGGGDGVKVHWVFSLRSDYNVSTLPFPTEEVDVIEEEIVRRFAMEFSDVITFMEVNSETRSRIRSCSATPMRGSGSSGTRGAGGTSPGGTVATPQALRMKDQNAETPPGARRGLLSSNNILPPNGPEGTQVGGDPKSPHHQQSLADEDVMTLTLPVNVLLVRYLGDFIGMADMVQDFIHGFSEKPSAVTIFVYDKHPEPVDQLSREQNVKIANAVNTELTQRNPYNYSPGSIISLTSLVHQHQHHQQQQQQQYQNPSSTLLSGGAHTAAGGTIAGTPPRLAPPRLAAVGAGGGGRPGAGGRPGSAGIGSLGSGSGYDGDYSDCEDDDEGGMRNRGGAGGGLNVVAIDTDGAYQHALTMLSTESFSCVRCHSVALLLYEEVRKVHMAIVRKVAKNGGSVIVGVNMFGGDTDEGMHATPGVVTSGGQVVSNQVSHKASQGEEMQEQSEPGSDRCVSSELIMELENLTLKTSEIIVKNLLTAGEEEKYLVLNHVSEKFHNILGRFPLAMNLLGNVGFADAEYTAPGGTVEPRLAMPVGLLPYCVPEIRRTLNCLQKELAARKPKKAAAPSSAPTK